jgi:tetratricopeptide (TPR) repeat protein
VQDRYLYVPLFGYLLVVFQSLAELGNRFLPGRIRRHAYAGALLLSLAFAALTARYNFAWRHDIALWERAVQVNPSSPHALGTLGFHYRVAGRTAEAQTVLDRAIEIDPRSADALLEAGILAAEQGRTRRAQALLRRALDAEPMHETIPDHLGKAFVTLGRYNAAIGIFEDARERHPHLGLKNTINIALTRRAAGDTEAAAEELEAIFEELESQPDPGLMLGLWHLGETYRQLGRREDADRSYRAYLLMTMGSGDPLSLQYRPLARERLGGTAD